MKTFLSILFAAIAVIILLNVWLYADGGSVAYRNMEEYLVSGMEKVISTEEPLETADVTETEAVQTTVAPEGTEAVTEVVTEALTEEFRPLTKATLFFGGDVNLDPDYSAAELYEEGGIGYCFSDTLLSFVKKGDFFTVGNVFSFTDSGFARDKAYTFSAESKNVSFYTDLGVDLVSLANNHSFDYSVAGYATTKNALANVGIATTGAGFNINEAAEPYYIDINGIKVAIACAMRSEKYIDAPEATEIDAGVMKMYELDAYLNEIRTAKENADFVVAYVHWGTENVLYLEQEQRDGARALIDAGADIVIGSHTHTVQTVEYYKGKPIFYSIGDFFSGETDKEGALIRVILFSDGEKEISFIPCESTNGYVDIADEETSRSMIERINLSNSANISNNGTVTEK